MDFAPILLTSWQACSKSWPVFPISWRTEIYIEHNEYFRYVQIHQLFCCEYRYQVTIKSRIKRGVDIDKYIDALHIAACMHAVSPSPVPVFQSIYVDPHFKLN